MSGGQKGFTLIELLVVIAILGVIAAVVALNVAGFFGRGTEQAANTEAHQVQTAVIAYMADYPGTSNLTGIVGPASNLGDDGDGVHAYLMNPGQLQADYTVTAGALKAATPIEEPRSQWTGCTFFEGLWSCG